MKRIDPGVKSYFESVSPADRTVLEALRKLVLENVALASETMLYGMPTYLLGKPVVSFKRQKNYFSLYVCDPEFVAAHAAELGALNCGKGCIRFRKWDQVPQAAVGRILREAAQRAGFHDAPAGAPKSNAC